MSDFSKGVIFVLAGGIFWASSGVMAQHLFARGINVEWVSFYRLFFSGLFLLCFSLKLHLFFVFKKPILRGNDETAARVLENLNLKNHKTAARLSADFKDEFKDKFGENFKANLKEFKTNLKFKLSIFTNLRELLSLVFFGLIGLMLCQYTYFEAIAHLDAGTATMIQYCAPVFIMLIVCLKTLSLPKFNEVAALFLMLTGMFLLASKGQMRLDINAEGLFWALVAAWGIVYYSLAGRAIIAKYGLSFVIGLGSLFGALFLGAFTQIWRVKQGVDFTLFVDMIFVVFVGTIGAFCLYLKGLEYVGAVKASILACVEPVGAALLAFLILGTSYSFLDIFSFALILLSVILVAREKA